MPIKKQLTRVLFLLSLLCCTTLTGAQAPVRKTLLSLYTLHPFTFLNETPFNEQGIAQARIAEKCPLQAVKIQFIPIVPPQAYLKHKMCYEEKLCIDKKGARFGGIRCCRHKDPLLKSFEHDYHHLVPELPFLKKHIHHPLLESQEPLKGPISRMFLYMALKYKFTLSNVERIQYENWHREYAPMKWEKQRNQLIKQLQGDGNPYIENEIR